MDTRTLPSTAGAPIVAPPASVPITAPAFRRLGEEVARLAGDLHAAQRGAHHPVGDDEAPPLPTGEVQVLARRLDALKRALEVAEVVEPDGRAVLGTSVTLRFDDGDVEVFELVAPCEVDPRVGRVSHESPLGAAVLGRRAGETVSLRAPAGLQLVTVLEVEAA
jgi:transcription elongation GreA/GreB family factor